jgi:hypothetical protein
MTDSCLVPPSKADAEVAAATLARYAAHILSGSTLLEANKRLLLPLCDALVLARPDATQAPAPYFRTLQYDCYTAPMR